MPRTLAGLVLVAGSLPAQAQTANVSLHVAFAAAPLRASTPAVAWLCNHWLPLQPEWPRGLDPKGPFHVVVDGDGIRIDAHASAVPPQTAWFGSLTIADAAPATFAGGIDGVEDWFVPHSLPVPAEWMRLLGELDALQLGHPRTLATAVLVGHVAGGLAHDDPRAELLLVAATSCGDATWTAWATPDHLRVRGRSDGGLTLPALLTWLGLTQESPRHGRSVRAFAARDEDAAEAARQLLRSAPEHAMPTLRALLAADDATRLAAIDTMVRHGASDELPAIVGAAGKDSPWATLAAADALRALWPHASPIARQRTREALARSASLDLRAFDPDRDFAVARLGGGNSDSGSEPSPAQVRALVWLGLFAVGLFWLLRRERLRTEKNQH